MARAWVARINRKPHTISIYDKKAERRTVDCAIGTASTPFLQHVLARVRRIADRLDKKQAKDPTDKRAEHISNTEDACGVLEKELWERFTAKGKAV